MERSCLATSNGTVNFRDIDGYENNEGRCVKWREIYRSDSLSSLTERDEERLEEVNVIIDCDLRTSDEQVMAPDRKWPGIEVSDRRAYAEDSSDNFVNDSHKLYRFLHHIPKIDSYLGETYQNVTLSPVSQKVFARVFAALLILPRSKVLVYHCSVGKDRTGMMIALILEGLGIDEYTVTCNYLLTNELYTFGLKRQFPNDSGMVKMANQMNITGGKGTAIKGIAQTVDTGYDGLESYFTKELGFSEQDLKDLRKLYLE